MVCADDTTGASASGPAESGGRPFGDPIPNGVYEILAQEGKAGFFRLDPLDSNPREIFTNPLDATISGSVTMAVLRGVLPPSPK
jgi:hypothetical protein